MRQFAATLLFCLFFTDSFCQLICKNALIVTFLCCRTEERAAGWYRLTREILKLPEAPSVTLKGSSAEPNDSLPPKATKDKYQKTRRPQPLIKLVMRRLCKIHHVLLTFWRLYLFIYFVLFYYFCFGHQIPLDLLKVIMIWSLMGQRCLIVV